MTLANRLPQGDFCISCGIAGAKLRRCTKERLCSACRQSPIYKILSLKQVLAQTELTEECVEDIQIGWTINPVCPKFPKQKIYREVDVLLRQLTLEGKNVDDGESPIVAQNEARSGYR